MSTPAGRPWRVMRISSPSASRKYRDRSSLTFARATAFIGRGFAVEPRLGLRLADDGEDFDGRFRDVIEHPNVVDTQAVLGSTGAAEPLDATPADLLGFEAEVALQRVPDPAARVRRQRPQLLHGQRSQDDPIPHSGQIVARNLPGRWLPSVGLAPALSRGRTGVPCRRPSTLAGC
jgi:hypothetical protein